MSANSSNSKRNKDRTSNKSVVKGYHVTSDKSGKETLNVSLDTERLREIQEEQERQLRKQSRRKAVKKLGDNLQNRIREGVKDEAPKSGDRDRDIKACKLEFHFINVIAMSLIFAVAAVFLVVAKRESGKSEHDNRELAAFPDFSVSAWLDGEFTEGVTDYYTDTVPYREKLLSFNSSLSKLFGLPQGSSGGTVIGNRGDVETEIFTGTVQTGSVIIHTGTQSSSVSGSATAPVSDEVPDPTGSATDSRPPATTLPVEDPNDGKLENGIMIIGKGAEVRALECYGGSFANGKKYAGFINKYKQELGETVNVYNMCIPTAFAYYCPERYRDEYGSTIDNINNIRSYLSGIADVDVYGALLPHTGEYIYSRTDHHWQPLGAYYAAQEFAKTAQVPFPDLSTYEKVVEEDFVGTLYAYSNYDKELSDNPDTFTYYKPANNSSLDVHYYDTSFKNGKKSQLFFKASQKVNLYSSFLGTDRQVAEIKTDCDNGRTLVIFKDSFGNALVPFLTSSFSSIYVVDLRYFDINAIQFCRDVGATDVLFATCMFTCTSGAKINYIENLRIQ